MTVLSPWQHPDDGFPTDAYFDAVETALTARGIVVADSWRDEPWDYTLQLWDEETAPKHGPLSWASHGLSVAWSVDDVEPRHADDFGDPADDTGWYWVPYTRPDALGEFTRSLGVPVLAEPGEVADAVAALLAGRRVQQSARE